MEFASKILLIFKNKVESPMILHYYAFLGISYKIKALLPWRLIIKYHALNESHALVEKATSQVCSKFCFSTKMTKLISEFLLTSNIVSQGFLLLCKGAIPKRRDYLTFAKLRSYETSWNKLNQRKTLASMILP